jgi:hypothetical protein
MCILQLAAWPSQYGMTINVLYTWMCAHDLTNVIHFLGLRNVECFPRRWLACLILRSRQDPPYSLINMHNNTKEYWVFLTSGTGVAICTATVGNSTSMSSESVYQMPYSWLDLVFYILLFEVLHLAWCYFAMNPTTEQHQILCKFRKMCDRDPDND